MALNDVFMLTLRQRFGDGGELLLNNFFYISPDAPANAAVLIDGFTDTGGMLELINDTQSIVIKNDGIRVINLGNLTDFEDRPASGAGAISSGECLPPFAAINYTLKVNTRAVRPGSKRIAGVAESVQAHGLVTDSGMITAIGALEIALADVVVEAGATFTPIVVKRVGLPTPGTPPYTSYRLPESDGELVYGLVTAAVVNLRVSHQVSRGNGR